MLTKIASSLRSQIAASSSDEKIEPFRYVFVERRLALAGLLISVAVIFGKLFHAYYDVIYGAVFEKELITYEVISENGQRMVKHGWTTVVKNSSLWLPVFCGALATYFTWLVVYLDSSVPGVQPPSPFSPSKYKTRSGHTYHLNYIFAVVFGVIVTTYMYWKEISLD